MKSRYQHNGITWIDLENPTRQEVIDVAAEFNLDAFTAEEMLAPSLRPHVDIRDNYVYLILHFPAVRHAHKHREQEIDFVVGRSFLITTHYDTVEPLQKFTKVFEVNAALEMGVEGDSAGHVFFYLTKRLYRAVEHEVEYVRRELSNIEEHIFSEHQIAMVSAISRAARNLLNLRQTIEPHRDVWKSLDADGAAFFGDEFRPFIRALEGEYYRVHNHIMRNTDSLHELRETNNSLLTTKQNETMKIFTIMAFVTFPLSLIAIILDMDSVHNPLHNMPYDFWIVIGIMVATATVMFAFFKKKNWI